ncbi:MAG: glycoside hydrolase family 3 N-terminal domain-containing protein [Bacteroidales bacterium]
MKKALLFTFSIVISILIFCNFIPFTIKPASSENKPFYNAEVSQLRPSWFKTEWVDSVYNSLTLEQKISQLLMIRVQTDQHESYYRKIEETVKNYNIGGLAFFRGGPERQLKITNRLQQTAQTPMLIAMDAEWGLSMRLDSTVSFPRQMTLGAIRGERHIYEMGMEIGYQAKRLGVHINFAPVIDVNNNSDNPVINFRSFGECRYNVARKGLAYMQGMQDAGIIACAKHFPGHGDTDTDSHHSLPVINHPYEVLDSIHLYPFKQLINNGLLSVMVAHLNIPALDNKENLPSTLSPKIVYDLLQDNLGFKGLVITDALDMRGVSDHYNSGELELEALKAGNDILLLPQDIEAAIKTIAKAIKTGEISQKYLEQKVKKVLYYKQAVGLNNYKPITTKNLYKDLNNTRTEVLNRRLVQSAITVVKNDKDILPIKNLHINRIASLSIGASKENPFQAMLNNYANVTMFSIRKNATEQEISKMLKELEGFDIVIVSIHNNSMYAEKKYGIGFQTIDIINKIAWQNNTILNLFANPYSLEYIDKSTIANLSAIMISYQDGVLFENAAAQAIFGGVPARGRLPVSIPPYFPAYFGVQTPGQFRIKYGIPEETGINSEKLLRIDSLALKGIEEKAFPGCQIAVLKNGIVIYNKSFGYHTYEEKRRVKNSDIYDLASITKIAASTLSIMKLLDDGKLDIDQSIDHYLSRLQGTNFAGIEIREILAHQAMLRSWIPFYLNTLENNQPSSSIYQNHYSEEFPIEVARNLFMHKNFKDSIFHIIQETPLLEKKRYVYSDLGFIMMAELIEGLVEEPLETFVQNNFYRPLGIKTLGFHPRNKFDLDRIVPSENDTLFRKQTLQGYVNDPAAAMLGGASGHAGLFGNAIDLAILMEMTNRQGYYGGEQYVKPETVKEFTTVQYAGNKNRRALGFDKPCITPDNPSPVCESASPESYGHSGFTGTFTWVDPAEKLVYVFVSNRTFPDQNNWKINEMDIRSNIHQAIYDAIYASRYFDTTLGLSELSKDD